ncbi:uncharacterized protein LOC141639489 [Silene latifolia]|uniref:uncharacterized protein LOC141639489 n=1 Tax=Silene latifolia TaxID=37657 RepID=UPI003D76FC41
MVSRFLLICTGYCAFGFRKAIEDFFATGHMPKQANVTLISLIPKKSTPHSVKDFRPISCCSIIYKTVTKIITLRMQELMPGLVGEEQAAFIKDRNLFENVMLTQSLVKGYQRKGITPRCMLKVDIRKAFDSLQWPFIHHMLAGFFKGQSGVRQGDPLSPYLFVLSMELLSRKLRQLCNTPNVSFHPKCVKLDLTHLVFADDLMIFLRGDLPSVSKATAELAQFSTWYLGIPIHASRLHADMYGALLLKSAAISGALASCCHTTLGNTLLRSAGNSSGGILMVAGKWFIKAGTVSVLLGLRVALTLKTLKSESGKAMLSWLWKLDQNKGSIWVNWMSKYYLQDHSIWLMEVREHHPECLRGIIQTRDHCIAQLGSCSHVKNLLMQCTVAGKFSIQHAYNALRTKYAVTECSQAIQKGFYLPKHRVILQLAAHNRLATVDHLISRGLPMVNRCSLCQRQSESTAHLFFACSYSTEVLLAIKQWVGINTSKTSLLQLLSWTNKRKHKRHWRIQWVQYSIAATVYSIWSERNLRIF